MELTDDGLAAWAAEMGLPGIADVHTHFLPPRMLRRVREHFDNAGPLIGRPWPIAYRGSDEQRVQQLDAMGVRMFSALAYTHRPAWRPTSTTGLSRSPRRPWDACRA